LYYLLFNKTKIIFCLLRIRNINIIFLYQEIKITDIFFQYKVHLFKISSFLTFSSMNLKPIKIVMVATKSYIRSSIISTENGCNKVEIFKFKCRICILFFEINIFTFTRYFYEIFLKILYIYIILLFYSNQFHYS
jgi:hypothetical protein